MTSSPVDAASSATSSSPNIFSRYATQLVSASTRSKLEQIYHDAVDKVMSSPQYKTLSPEVIDLITSQVDETSLRQAVKDQRSNSKIWKGDGKSKVMAKVEASVSGLERFQDAVNTMISSNPAISALVWGGVRFVLTIAREVFATFEILADLVDNINLCVERFAKYIRLLKDSDTAFRKRLVNFYAVIVEFCVQAHQLYSKSRTQTLIAVLRSPSDRPFKELLVKLKENDEEMVKYLHLLMVEDVNGLREDVRTSGRPLPAPATPLAPGARVMLPNLLSKHFTGRQEILDQLSHATSVLVAPGQPHKASLWGIPGVGKSQVSLRFAEEHKSSYAFRFFIRCAERETIIDDYYIIADKLKLFESNGKPEERFVLEKVKEWLANNDDWLMIYDNVGNPGELRDFTPNDGSGYMLFTTRSRVAADSLVDNQVNSIEVEPLPLKQAMELTTLLLNVKDPGPPLLMAARELSILVGCLPIAIEQAAILTGLLESSLPAILHQVQARRQILKGPHPTSLHEGHLSTGALISLTLDAVAKEHLEAASLFKLMVYLETSAIPIDLFREGGPQVIKHFNRTEMYDRGSVRSTVDEHVKSAVTHNPATRGPPSSWRRMRLKSSDRQRQSSITGRIGSRSDQLVENYFSDDKAIRAVLSDPTLLNYSVTHLEEAGLVRRKSGKTIWVHDLFRKFTLEMIEDSSTDLYQVKAHLILIMVFLAFPEPPESYSYFKIFDKTFSYHPHVLSVLRHCRPFIFDTTIGPEMMHIAASCFHMRRNIVQQSSSGEAKFWYFEAFKGYLAAWRRTRQTTSDLDIIKQARAEYANTPEGITYRHILGTYERFGQAPKRAFGTLLKLGNICANEGKPAEGLKWVTLAHRGYSSLLGPSSDLAFSAFGYRVQLLQDMGNYKEGLLFALKRVELYEQTWGDLTTSSPGQTCARAVGALEEKLGHYEAALVWYNSAQFGLDTWYPKDYEWRAANLLILAGLNEKLHRHRKALGLAEQAVRLRQTESLKLFMDEARCDMATSLLSLGRTDQAREVLGQIWMSRREAYVRYGETPGFARAVLLKTLWNLHRLYSISRDASDIPVIEEDGMLVDSENAFGNAIDSICCSLHIAERDT